nr:MAG TPA: hypothetical protein [Caudoviricetes sp.]
MGINSFIKIPPFIKVGSCPLIVKGQNPAF